MDVQYLISRLAKVRHFQNFSPTALKDIVLAGQVLNYPAESTIFGEGEPGAGLHVLLRGQVHLCKIGLQGLKYIVYIVKPVIMFNEVTVVDNQPNPVTAVANHDCTTWQISYERFQMLMKRHPEIGLGLLKIMASRNRALIANYDDLMSRPVLARTAKIILTLSEGGQRPIDRYEHTNQKIAAMGATVPEAVSRSIKILLANEVIETTRAVIRVTAPEELTEFALLEPMELTYSGIP